ncbi:ThuA domain-containing protein [Acidipila sp. EB88]|nr:ThuA domain-containing protein [Acidipila sp. EB88]
MQAQQVSPFHVLAFYGTEVEADHVAFAKQAILFFQALALKDKFDFETTTSFNDLNAEKLSHYQLILWLDDIPSDPAQRAAFQQYAEHGGAWLGFHIAGYNDDGTHWPWFVQFLGGSIFLTNSWPPLPANLAVENKRSPVTRSLPGSFLSPANEWYIWKPDPRENKDVQVLVSLKASNYPLGWKDTLVGGDLPVVWTNTRYHMLYINMGHGDKIFTSAIQNRLFENALLWFRSGRPKQLP